MRKTSLLLICAGLLLSGGAPSRAQTTPTPGGYTQADVRTLDQQVGRFPRKATASVLCTNENVSELKALLVKASSLAWQRSRDSEASTKRSQLEKLLKEHELTPAQATKIAEAAVAYRKARSTSNARRKSTAEKAGEAAGEAVEAAVETVKAGAAAAQELATAAAQVAFDFMKGFVQEVKK
ncbi:hypothetical protein [Armatimonas rosea]|uniref:Uncharacterized protein n=1 Tax=Armatimonas rosea TaxID=685828 RepID=A0A7W9SRZ2_ARMRO|nr:hypothetical protein [Armatimonas rosea]MBB6051099.1 hypothetical protein [Armatimonas rosea]